MTKLIPLASVRYELEHVPGAYSVDVGEYRTRLEEAIARIPVVERQEWLPIESAPKDKSPVLVLFKDHIYPGLRPDRPDLEVWNGKQAVLSHPPLPDDGFDIGWSLAAPVGMGGFPDEWIEGYQPLPAKGHRS